MSKSGAFLMIEDMLREPIARVTEIAAQESSTLESLSLALRELSTFLEQRRVSALAYIAEIASQSCTSGCVSEASARLAIIDICERIVTSLETSQPFDFSNADDSLLAILFPEELPLEAIMPAAFQQSAEFKATSPQGLLDANETQFEICPCSDEQLIKGFLAEANEHLQVIEQQILALENDPRSREAVNELFRAVHSIKGSTSVLELKSLGELTHLTESVLVRVRDGQLGLRGDTIKIIFAGADAIAAQITAITQCYAKKRALEYPLPRPIVLVCLEELRKTGICSDLNLSKLLRLSSGEDGGNANTKVSVADTLRVDSKRLEQLIDLIGELVITDAMVQRELRSRASVTSSSISQRLRKVVREVQQLSLTLKMIPIGTVLQKMNRLVRDLSSKLNKQVELQIIGAETEVDKTLLECIADPLVHLLRNSIDHGIEPTLEERIAAGKPAVATIRIKAEHRGGSVLLHISDDGRGLDRERILQRAIENKLVSVDSQLTDDEIDSLIFEPGFSTATKVTEISGRGVGMDVVKKNIEALRGSISLTSRPGQGTDICLELPLTLSIIDGTVVRVRERCFIIPTLSVIEQVQLGSLEFSGSVDCRMVRFRSKFVSVRRLGDVLGTTHAEHLKHGQVVIIVECGTRQHAIIVDEVLGQQPIVIKPLGGVLSGVGFFAGGALLSDGQVAFVLDLNAVCSAGI